MGFGSFEISRIERFAARAVNGSGCHLAALACRPQRIFLIGPLRVTADFGNVIGGGDTLPRRSEPLHGSLAGLSLAEPSKHRPHYPDAPGPEAVHPTPDLLTHRADAELVPVFKLQHDAVGIFLVGYLAERNLGMRPV
jgi:hypothetical protein